MAIPVAPTQVLTQPLQPQGVNNEPLTQNVTPQVTHAHTATQNQAQAITPPAFNPSEPPPLYQLPISTVQWPQFHTNLPPPLPQQDGDQILAQGYILPNLAYKQYIPPNIVIEPIPQQLNVEPVSLHPDPNFGYGAIPRIPERVTNQTVEHYATSNLQVTRDHFNNQCEKLSERVGTLENANATNNAWHELMLKQIRNIDAYTASQNENIKNLYENVGNVRVEMNALKETVQAHQTHNAKWHEVIKKTLQNESIHIHQELQDIKNVHKRTTDGIKNAMITLTDKVVSLEQGQSAENPYSNIVSGRPIQCILQQSTNTTPKALKENGIYFDESNKHHPWHFVRKFNNFLKNVNMTKENKCLTFKALVEI